MPELYQEIASNKRRTTLLLIGFSTFVLLLAWLLGVGAFEMDAYSAAALGFSISAIYSLISYYFSSSIALTVAGAKAIVKSDHPELYRLVENIAITAGLPTPKIYIIDDASPNAFATGRSPKTASVAFTTGLLQILDKQELEGVVAHEMSHVKNYDTRLMTIVVVLIGLISLLSNLLLHMPRRRSSDDNNGGVAAIAMLVGFLLGILSPLLAKLIQLAISRTREYLADSSAIMLTRYPDGLISALQKISTNPAPLKNANEATAHLYISNPFGGAGKKVSNLFSTHPPIADRIARLQKLM